MPHQSISKQALLISACFLSLITNASLWAASDPPARCTGYGDLQSILLTDWENGLGSWTAGTHDVVDPVSFATPDWASVGSLPDSRAGNAAFVANLDIGDCGPDDQAGALTLDSSPIAIPGDAEVPRISFHHWFETEFGFDGGNIKVSVNGGAFEIVPASAFEYGPHNDTLFPALDVDGPDPDDNTNPLAGQEAFTGTIDDNSSGSWMQSRVNLLGIAAPGDSIKLRFDFGIDSCDGDVGWYVDDVEVYSCAAADAGLTLIKKVINNNDGSAVPADWTLSAAGPTGFSGTGPDVSSGEGFQAGTYDLSESGGPTGYTASDWVCDGGSQVDADTVTLAEGESAVCTITNDDIDSSFQINAGQAGAWHYPANSGQGLLIDLDPEEQFMFVAWFTYTDAASENPFEQQWYTAQGSYNGNTAELDLFETLGGKFDDPQEVTFTPVGELTLSFDDCGHGQATYHIVSEELQGEFPLERAIPGSGNTCEELGENSTQSVDINAGMDGSWYEPVTSGQGFLIDSYPDPEGGNFIFVAWFTYGDDTASGQRWLTTQGSFAGSIAQMDVWESTGGSFDDPKPPSRDNVGTMSIDFTDCSNAILTYALTDDGVEGDIAIQRAVPGAQALCEEIAGTE